VQESRETFPPADLPGRWIAWDENQDQILAAADSYLALMRCIDQLGLVDPVIERAPGVQPMDSAVPVVLLNGESSDILQDVRETIPDADRWLDTPNTRLGYQRPRDLIGTPGERQLRYLLRGLWSGITS
jgi:hypothetical protein